MSGASVGRGTARTAGTGVALLDRISEMNAPYLSQPFCPLPAKNAAFTFTAAIYFGKTTVRN